MYKHYCKQAISAEVTALENERVCVQLPTSADYVTLLALAAVLLCAMLLQRLAAATDDLAWLSTDIAWLPGPQQQTINSFVQRSIDETDRQTLYHYTDPAMYHASSVKNMSPSLALQTFLNWSVKSVTSVASQWMDHARQNVVETSGVRQTQAVSSGSGGRYSQQAGLHVRQR